MVQLDLGLLDVVVDGRDKGVFGKEKGRKGAEISEREQTKCCRRLNKTKRKRQSPSWAHLSPCDLHTGIILSA